MLTPQRALLALALALSSAAVVAQTRPGAVSDSILAAKIDAFVPAAMAQLGVVPGLSIAVVRGNTTIYTNGFGVADVAAGTRVTADTVFYTASMAKAVTGRGASERERRWQPFGRFGRRLHVRSSARPRRRRARGRADRRLQGNARSGQGAESREGDLLVPQQQCRVDAARAFRRTPRRSERGSDQHEGHSNIADGIARLDFE